MGTDKRGRYRIQAVVEATGISAPTLRSWERRYGVPTPERTQSAYRLYSDEDIALISRMRDLTLQGMAAAEAAASVRGMTVNEAPEMRDPYEVAADGIVDATHDFDPYAIELAVQRALTLGDATTVYERVISRAMKRIGEDWAGGTLSVAQEHVAADITTNALRDMLRLVQPADATRSILLGCFQGERHVLGLYGIGLRFAAWGFKTTSLGPDCPPDAVADAVRKLTPDVVGLSLTVAADVSKIQELIPRYAEACAGVPWIVGGRGTELIREAVEANGGAVVEGDPSTWRSLVEKHVRRGVR